MSNVDFGPYFLIFVGCLCLVGGLGSALLYQRPQEFGLDAFLTIAGIAALVIAYFNLPIEDRMLIKDVPSSLGLTKERFVYCVDCKFYCGTYDVSVRNVNGRPVVHQEPRFEEGACMRQGLLIHDGFRPRKCYYFKRNRG